MKENFEHLSTQFGYICPTCGSRRQKKNGHENGSQRYKCKSCGKNYRSTTGSSVHRLHKKDVVKQYIYCLSQGYTLRRAAKETGISLATSFAWRHRLLASMGNKAFKQLDGILITSAMTLPYSEKGNRKSSLKSEKSKLVTSILQQDTLGRATVHTASSSQNEIFKRFSLGTIYLPSKRLPVIFKQNTAIRKDSGEKAIVQNMQNQLLEWIHKFRGVATKYLNHYWAWFVELNDFEINQNHSAVLLSKCL